MAGMNFVTLYGTQLDVELASADRTNLFTATRRKKAINDAMHNWERIVGATEIFGTIPIVSTTAEYDLFLNFPNYVSLADRAEPYVKIVDASANVRYLQGDSLARRDPVWLDREDPGWRADPSSTPTNWYLREDTGTSWVGLDPAPLIPAGYTYTLGVPYLASATDMVNDTDLPFTLNGIPLKRLIPYQQALVHYAAGLLETLRRNPAGADRQMKFYAGYVAQYETKQLKDSPSMTTYVRNYLRDARGRAARPVDPHRFP